MSHAGLDVDVLASCHLGFLTGFSTHTLQDPAPGSLCRNEPGAVITLPGTQGTGVSKEFLKIRGCTPHLSFLAPSQTSMYLFAELNNGSRC